MAGRKKLNEDVVRTVLVATTSGRRTSKCIAATTRTSATVALTDYPVYPQYCV